MNIHYGPVTELQVDAIVNAANTQLRHGGGVAAAIVRAGGRTIQEESDRIGWCDLGKAVATGAGNLKARYVIHVPTIDYTRGRRAGLDDIYEGTRSALQLCRDLGLKSVGFPAVGRGHRRRAGARGGGGDGARNRRVSRHREHAMRLLARGPGGRGGTEGAVSGPHREWRRSTRR